MRKRVFLVLFSPLWAPPLMLTMVAVAWIHWWEKQRDGPYPRASYQSFSVILPWALLPALALLWGLVLLVLLGILGSRLLQPRVGI
jgi:hypothetical protein